jgi:hypothetical protein
MARDLETLVVSLEARLTKFDRDMKKAEGISARTTRKIEGDFKRLDSKLSRFSGASLGGILASVTGTAIVSQINQVVRELAKIGDAADKVGLTAEQFQQLGFAAKQSGSSVEAMGDALQQFGKRVGEAAMGQGDLLKLFQANGVALRDQAGNIRPLNDLFLEFADLVKNAGSQSERLKIATVGAGKSATDLVTTLATGSQGLKEFGIQAAASGNVIENDLVKAAQEFDDKFYKFFDGAMKRAQGHTMRLIIAIKDAIVAIDKLGSAAPAGLPGQVSNALRSAPIIGGIIQGWDALAGTPGGIDPEAVVMANRQATQGERLRRERFPPPTVGLPPSSGGKAPKEQFKDAIEVSDTAMKEFISTMDDAREATRGFFGDLISGLREGATLTETLSRAFQNLADKMINKLLDQAVDALLGPSGTAQSGVLGQLLGVVGKDQSRLDTSGMSGAGGAGGAAGAAATMVGGIFRQAAGGGGGAALSGVPFADLINEAAAKYGLDPTLLAGLIKQESRFNPNAVSPAGAQGLAQLMPGTARDLGVTNPFDPRQSVMGGADYLSKMMKLSGGDPAGALARYNAGPGGNFNNPETKAYVPQVLAYQKEFADSLKTVADTTKTAATSFVGDFAPAVTSIIQTVASSFTGGGGFAAVSGGLFGGGRASGGPIDPGMIYKVHKDELIMPRVPGIVVPKHVANGGGMGGMSVEVIPSKYFDVHVRRAAEGAGGRAVNAARRGYPQTAARFHKLGTT